MHVISCSFYCIIQHAMVHERFQSLVKFWVNYIYVLQRRHGYVYKILDYLYQKLDK